MRLEWAAAAAAEYRRLSASERLALDTAIEKLEVVGDRLPYPHSSAVRGAGGWRELRPRRGRSPVRALYRRHGDRLLLFAVGPEAEHDRLGFAAMLRRAEERWNAWLEDQREQDGGVAGGAG